MEIFFAGFSVLLIAYVIAETNDQKKGQTEKQCRPMFT